MNKTELKKGQELLTQIKDRFDKQDSILQIALEQHAVLGMHITQLSVMYAPPKPKSEGGENE